MECLCFLGWKGWNIFHVYEVSLVVGVCPLEIHIHPNALKKKNKRKKKWVLILVFVFSKVLICGFCSLRRFLCATTFAGVAGVVASTTVVANTGNWQQSNLEQRVVSVKKPVDSWKKKP